VSLPPSSSPWHSPPAPSEAAPRRMLQSSPPTYLSSFPPYPPPLLLSFLPSLLPYLLSSLLPSLPLSLPADSLLTLPGMILLYKHISALGIFGKTALIHPMYGTGELPQVFGPYLLLKTNLFLYLFFALRLKIFSTWKSNVNYLKICTL
jgi:hypothetical protein